MIELKAFTEHDFDVLKSWIQNEEELFQFAGPIFSYPVTDEQLRAYINMPDKKPLKVVLISTNETIGHCELNFENGLNRLSRIIIGNKNLRGQNIGEQIVRKMVDLFFKDSKINEVDLHVFEWNTRAIKCYEKVGFAIKQDHKDEFIVNGKIWTRLKMILKRHLYVAQPNYYTE